MKRSTGSDKKAKRRIGRQPKRPVTIAPKFLAMFTEVAQPRRQALLAAYVQEGGNIPRAIKAARGGCLHSHWLRNDPDYRRAFERAKRVVGDAREREILLRARRGVPMSNARLMSVLRYARRESYSGNGNKGKL
jgi:hypothetical protein